MDNEILTELEKLQDELNNEQAHLVRFINLRLGLFESHLVRVIEKIKLEQEAMGAALAKENKGGD